MALPIREQLLAHVAASVAAINPTNGYVTTVAECGRLRSSPLIAQMRLPATIVHDVDDVPIAPGEDTPGFEIRTLGFVIEHWRHEASKGAISTELNLALADHYRAVMGPDGCGYQGGAAALTNYGGVITLLSEKNVDLGGFQARFESQYQFVVMDPTAG